MPKCLIGSCPSGKITSVSTRAEGVSLNPKFLPTSSQAVDNGALVANITQIPKDLSKGTGNGI